MRSFNIVLPSLTDAQLGQKFSATVIFQIFDVIKNHDGELPEEELYSFTFEEAKLLHAFFNHPIHQEVRTRLKKEMFEHEGEYSHANVLAQLCFLAKNIVQQHPSLYESTSPLPFENEINAELAMLRQLEINKQRIARLLQQMEEAAKATVTVLHDEIAQLKNECKRIEASLDGLKKTNAERSDASRQAATELRERIKTHQTLIGSDTAPLPVASFQYIAPQEKNQPIKHPSFTDRMFIEVSIPGSQLAALVSERAKWIDKVKLLESFLKDVDDTTNHYLPLKLESLHSAIAAYDALIDRTQEKQSEASRKAEEGQQIQAAMIALHAAQAKQQELLVRQKAFQEKQAAIAKIEQEIERLMHEVEAIGAKNESTVASIAETEALAQTLSDKLEIDQQILKTKTQANEAAKAHFVTKQEQVNARTNEIQALKDNIALLKEKNNGSASSTSTSATFTLLKSKPRIPDNWASIMQKPEKTELLTVQKMFKSFKNIYVGDELINDFLAMFGQYAKDNTKLLKSVSSLLSDRTYRLYMATTPGTEEREEFMYRCLHEAVHEIDNEADSKSFLTAANKKNPYFFLMFFLSAITHLRAPLEKEEPNKKIFFDEVHTYINVNRDALNDRFSPARIVNCDMRRR